jgi:hypothetical protein
VFGVSDELAADALAAVSGVGDQHPELAFAGVQPLDLDGANDPLIRPRERDLPSYQFGRAPRCTADARSATAARWLAASPHSCGWATKHARIEFSPSARHRTGVRHDIIRAWMARQIRR